MASLDARFMSQSLQEQETEQGQGEGTSDVSRRVTAADLNLGSFSPLRRLASHDLGHDHELTPRGAPTTEQRSPMSSMFDQYINSPNFAVDGPTDEWGFADREGHHSEQGCVLCRSSMNDVADLGKISLQARLSGHVR